MNYKYNIGGTVKVNIGKTEVVERVQMIHHGINVYRLKSLESEYKGGLYWYSEFQITEVTDW